MLRGVAIPPCPTDPVALAGSNTMEGLRKDI
jgi:hypothetical protein